MALRPILAAVLALLLSPPIAAAGAQPGSWTPNTRAAWTHPPGRPGFSFVHRFEVISGGDELLNIPTLTLGTAIARWIAVGVDYTSNTEVAPQKLGGNEAEFWLNAAPLRRQSAVIGLTGAYNSAARSLDGAATARLDAGRFSIVPELRAFSDAFASGDAGFAGAIGAIVRLTPYLRIAGDVGQGFSSADRGSVWSGGLSITIPETPHTLSLHATNGGATTLQATSRPKVLGSEGVRFGFTFFAPLTTLSQWRRIFGADPDDREEGASSRRRGMSAHPIHDERGQLHRRAPTAAPGFRRTS